METDESGEKKDETQSKDKGGEEKMDEGKEKVQYAVSDLGLHCLLWFVVLRGNMVFRKQFRFI